MADAPEMTDDDSANDCVDNDKRKFQLEMKHLMETAELHSPTLTVSKFSILINDCTRAVATMLIEHERYILTSMSKKKQIV